MKYLRHTHNNQILNLCHTRQNLTRDNNKRHWIQRTEKACLKKKKKRREDDGMIQTKIGKIMEATNKNVQ
jgi:hypothetical protein